MKNSVRQHSDLVVYPLRHTQPVKTHQRISDMVGAHEVEDQPCCSVQCGLHPAYQVRWDANQRTVAIIQPLVDEDNCQSFKALKPQS